MILVDTSVWIEHLRAGGPTLTNILDRGFVLSNPWVAGELALGHLSRRAEILTSLTRLPQAVVVTSREILTFIERHQLFGLGIGYLDAQLLASTYATADARLWTNDKRLAAAARRLGRIFEPHRPRQQAT